MHYYKKNLGDYYKKAGRLSILQHGVYTLLIDACYDREQFPTLEEAVEWTWASTPEEVEAVEFVLKRFFTFTDGVYVQKRIKEELADYANQKTINSANGKKGGRPRKKQKDTECEAKKTQSVLKETQSVNLETEKKPNQKPLTINHKPETREGGTPPTPHEKRKRFIPPSLDDVREYKRERGSSVDPESFVDFYESKNWYVGKNKMKCWQSAFRTWERRENTTKPSQSYEDRIGLVGRVI